MNNNYHSFISFILAFLLFETYAQVPIKFFNFKLNNKTTTEIINSVSESGVTSEGGVILDVNGNPPVELSTFNIRIIKDNAQLSWSSDSEINSNKFVIQRMSSEDMNWRNAGEVFASGNSNSPKYYSFTDKNLEANFYSYRLKMIDNNGSFEYSHEVHTEINLEDEFELSQNYPNPFNPETIITYKLPEKSHVSLQIFNILGNEIVEILNEEKPAGVHKVEIDISVIAPELPNGTYFYRLKAGSYTETKKMIYLK